jgi:hypothetical protein
MIEQNWKDQPGEHIVYRSVTGLKSILSEFTDLVPLLFRFFLGFW